MHGTIKYIEYNQVENTQRQSVFWQYGAIKVFCKKG